MVLVSLPTYISAFSAARALGRIGKFFYDMKYIFVLYR